MEDKFIGLRDTYHDKVYAKSNVMDGQFKNACLMYHRLYGKFMPEDKDARIADIACGGGQFLRYCLNNGYGNIIGIDLSPGQVNYVKENVTQKVLLANGLDYLGDNPTSFDLVVANDFIEHLTKDRGIELVRLAHKALRPNGRIILKTGNMAAFGGLVIWCNGIDHECGYTERSLRALLNMWDFRQVTIIPYFYPRGLRGIAQRIFHFGLRQLYRYIYEGNYPRVYTKIIAVTGVAD